MNTQAAVLFGHELPVSIEELSIPELQPGQVLVRIAYSGICHSQLNEIRGLKGEDRFLPHTLGHEGSGIVESVGADVTKVKSGDHVVLTWIAGIGLNAPSMRYQVYGRQSWINSGAISTFMSRAVVAENRLVKIREDMPLKIAALLGCAVPTGAGIVLHAGLPEGCTIAVFGAGGIGLSALLAAKSVGAEKIIAVDIYDHKLEMAGLAGATHVINASSTDVLGSIMDATSGRGVDCAIECAGATGTMETAFKVTRDNGGLCVLAGNLPYGQTISIDPFALIKGRRLIGSWGGSTVPDRDIPRYVDDYLAGKLNLDMLVMQEYLLSDINNGLVDLENGRLGRALIKLADCQ